MHFRLRPPSGGRRRCRRHQGRSLCFVASALAAAAVVLGGCSGAAGTAPAPPAPLSLTATAADQSFLPDQAIQPLVLPAAAGGSGALTYSLSPEVPGLTFDAGSRTLTGAPTQLGEYAMTYAVRDGAGAAVRLTFTIYVDYTVRYLGGDQVFFLNPDGVALDDVEYTLRLGDTLADVYLIATNGGDGGAPEPRASIVDLANPAASQPLAFSLRAQPGPQSQPAPDRAWVTEHNNSLPSLLGAASRLQSAQPTGPRRAVTRGSRETLREIFRDGSFKNIPATARAVVTDGSVTAVVWVADREWGCAARQCVTQSLVDSVANRFLRQGSANDIYDWVTAIYGAPWGPHQAAGFIPPSAAGEIHLLLYDINDDGLPTPGDSVRVVGYFHGLHNCLRADPSALCRGSNERLMFFVDSPFLTFDTDLAADNLAHELQHMIHFYQKPVLRGARSEAWLNEMASEVGADLIADKIQVNGPRGVAYDDPTAGQPGNRFGRLPMYNLHNDLQVTAWQGTLANYSINYALGAYLARNYGGAELFGRIVQSERSGVDAVEGALRDLGHRVSFPQVLANWAAAGLLSDNTEAPAPYRYNTGTWRTSRVSGTTYRLGSINLYHYVRPDTRGRVEPGRVGPRVDDLNAFRGRVLPPHSNRYAALGRVSSAWILRLSAAAGLRVTVVFKE